MKQLIQATLLLAECFALTLVLSSCGEPTRQTPSTAPDPGAAVAPSPSEEAEVITAAEPSNASEEGAPASAEPAATPRRAATAGTASGLTVRRIVVARDVENREPVGAGRSFDRTGEPLFAFLEVASSAEDDQQIQVTFEHDDGRSVGHVTLDIPGGVPRWRTWALSHNVTSPGEWRAVVRTAEGELLAEIPFEMI